MPRTGAPAGADTQAHRPDDVKRQDDYATPQSSRISGQVRQSPSFGSGRDMPMSVSDSESDSGDSSGTPDKVPRKAPSDPWNSRKPKWESEQARARRKDVEKLQRLLNRDKQSRKRTAARLTEKYEEAVRNLQMQHNRQTDEMQGTLRDLAAEFVTAHYYHAGYLQEQTAQHNDLRTRVTELENELRMTKQQVEGQARQLAARWNHHAPTNTLNTGASTSALLDAGNHMHGPPGAPHMHPAHMAYGQPLPAALHDHRNNVLGLLGPPRPHPVKDDEFTAPFATPQLQRAAPHDHTGSAHTSYSYNPRGGPQANNVAVLGSDDTSINVADDGNIGGTASLWPPLTFDPAFSTRPRASPTRGLLNPPHNPVSPIYGPVKLDSSPEPVYTQLDQGGEWLPALQ